MKKNLGALFAALVLGGAVFAENYTKGIDLQFGTPIATTKMRSDLGNYDGASVELAQSIFEWGGQFKIATYDCFALNDMLRIYASVGVNVGAFSTWTDATADIDGMSMKVSDEGRGVDEFGFLTSLEFMIGPAFGVDLGGVRFQTGLAFHGVVAWGFTSKYYEPSEYGYGGHYYTRIKVKYTSLGLALTPQFRFGASKRCSFVLGLDLTFDFPKKLTYENDYVKYDFEFDKGFRFGATPYIGIGINF